MAPAVSRDPLLVIIGATGTGKSKLAVELATRFNGEIINGDAMQMYKGLPIITNKIPEHERNGIPHHLIDFIGLDEETWTVSRFVNEAQKLAQEIRGRGRLPILVGGTHYYTQSLLFRNSLVHESDKGDAQGNEQQGVTEWPILDAPTEEMYAKLQKLDLVIASRWHPKDRRHIRRSLEICLQTGRKASDVYAEQEGQKKRGIEGEKNAESDSDEMMEQREHLRYRSLIFWLHSHDEVLKARLNDRVNTMIADGLIQEALAMSKFRDDRISEGSAPDIDKGIWVSIGYKEMQPYIAALGSSNCGQEDLTRIRDECIEAVMAHTRQYAKRQTRRIRLTLMDVLRKAGTLDKLFLLDCTDPKQWAKTVFDLAERITGAFLKASCLPEPKTLSSLAKEVLTSSSQGKPQFLGRKCSVCNKILMTDHEWNVHLKSSGHKKIIQGQRMRMENERRRQAAAATRGETMSGDISVPNG